MEMGVTVIVVSLIYMILVSIVYFSKKKLNNAENKIYSVLVKLNIIGLLLELLCSYFVYNRELNSIYNLINTLVNRTFLIYILTWILTFTVYILYISFNENNDFEIRVKNNKNRIYIILILLYFFLFILVNVLPLYYFSNSEYVYSYGPATNILLALCGITVGFDIFCLFKNIKNIRSKKYYPLFVLVLLMFAAVVIRKLNPGLIVINSCFAFISVLMYFTIENPDLQMVNELVRNKEIAEKSIEEKSNFLFKMTNEVKSPINHILALVKKYKISEKNTDRNIIINEIEESSKNLVFTVNEVLNISSMDIKKIKITELKYNIKNFCDELNLKISNTLNGIDYKFSVSSSLSGELNGDYIKLRQILISLITNINKKNEVSNVDIDISNINKYGVTRLIFNIKCNSCLFSLLEINNLVESNGELNSNDENDLNNLDMSYELLFKVLKLMGGNYNISCENNETIFELVIDQKNASNNVSDINKYSKNDDTVAILSDDNDELNNLSKKLSNYKLTLMLDSRDLIEKIKNNSKYKLIIMKDEMHLMNAYTTIKNLNSINGFKIKCIVILDKNKESIKEQYIKDGFTDYILLSDIDKELDRIRNQYL